MVTGNEFEGYYETAYGLIKVWSRVVANGNHILFDGLALYPTSSTRIPLAVGDGVRIFHSIMDEARELGFVSCTVEAFRTGGRKPGRMLVMTRRLR